MMVRLGLRAGELAALSLGDIDWRRGEITVVGEGPRSERLPLPRDVGAAVADYLRRDERRFAGFLSHGASDDGGRDDVEES